MASVSKFCWNGKVVYGNGAEYESGKYSDSGPLKENNKANRIRAHFKGWNF
jgi:hypothetical protein